MENEGSGDWLPDGLSDEGDADLGAPDETALPDSDLGYDATDPGESDLAADEYGADGAPEHPEAAGELGDAELNDEPGLGAAPVGEDTYPEAADATVGSDPDANPLADDDSWGSDPFPAALDLEQPPEPVDGMPWSDPALLGNSDNGGQPLADPADGYAGTPPVDDLYAYDGADPPADGTGSWGSLARSEDPATSSLARFWAPGGQ